MTSPAPTFAPAETGQRIWKRLGASEAAHRFQVAFSVATGLPLTLVPVATPAPAPSAPRRGAFCIDGCMGRHSGKPCLQTFQDAEQSANKSLRPVKFQCPAGLLKVIVPVLIGGQHVGNLLAGPFSLKQLDHADLSGLTDRLRQNGLEEQMAGLQASWRTSPVISTEKVDAVLTLVSVFAEYLAHAGQQLLVAQPADAAPGLLQKVESYLAEADEGEVSLNDVARRVSVSRCHFCKLFKKQTGVTFSEYRLRRRLDKAQQLLLDPGLRISEAAFQAGFESLPYFNRAFRRHLGCSPSEYRLRKGLHNAGQ